MGGPGWWGALAVPPQCSQPLASPSPAAAPREAAGAAGGGAGAERAAVLGAGQRRPLPRALLHRAEPRAAPRPVGPALRPRQPQRHRLRRGQVRGGDTAGDDASGGFRPASVSPSHAKCWYEAGSDAQWEGGWLGGAPLAAPTPSRCAPCRLKPFTSYKFRVKATNDIGDSEYSEESESLTTLQAGQHLLGRGQRVPPCPREFLLCPGRLRGLTTLFSPTAPEEAPTILSITPHTTTSVLIRWQVPSPLPRPGRWHRGVAGAREPWIRAAPECLPLSPCSPRLRTRSTGSCWGSGCATGSCCTTACGAPPCAASAGPRSPVSAPGTRAGLAWGGGGSGGLSSAAPCAPQHLPGTRVRPCLLELSPALLCRQLCGPSRSFVLSLLAPGGAGALAGEPWLTLGWGLCWGGGSEAGAHPCPALTLPALLPSRLCRAQPQRGVPHPVRAGQ